jgi:hypothetical protein
MSCKYHWVRNDQMTAFWYVDRRYYNVLELDVQEYAQQLAPTSFSNHRHVQFGGLRNAFNIFIVFAVLMETSSVLYAESLGKGIE